MGVLCFIYMICALRTNVVFVLIFAFLVPAFSLLTAAYWNLALGNTARAGTLQIAAGACTFIVCCCGWWIFSAIMLASLDFPFQIPGMYSAPRRVRFLYGPSLTPLLQSATCQPSSRAQARRRRRGTLHRMSRNTALVPKKLRLFVSFCWRDQLGGVYSQGCS